MKALISNKPASKGKGLWKFHDSLLLNEEFITKMRNCIHLKIMKLAMKILMMIKFDGSSEKTRSIQGQKIFQKMF